MPQYVHAVHLRLDSDRITVGVTREGTVTMTPDPGVLTPDEARALAAALVTCALAAPERQADAGRDAELEAEMEETAARYRRNFSAALARSDDVWQFDPDRIAEVYAADFDTSIRPFLQEMTRWCERVGHAARRARSGATEDRDRPDPYAGGRQ